MEASVATTSSGNPGPLGQPRGVGFGILMYIITLGIYSLWWIYMTMEEIAKHTAQGLGGVLSLVIWILISPVMGFVTPSEIGKMYERDGQTPPVSGWTGLWFFPFGFLIIPAIVWFVKVQGALNDYWGSKGPRPARAGG